jgi:hypothetical protein
LEKIGLLSKIADAETLIDKGRKWLDIDGREREGRVSYRNGLTLAMEVFQEVQSDVTANLELLILAEHSFLAQELQFCDSSDFYSITSLTQAIQDFDDAFLALHVVDNGAVYRGAELTYPHKTKYRFKEMPRDAFHIACFSHRTRIGNILRTPGLNLAEKELLKLRSINLSVAQTAYLEKQIASLSASN